MSAIVGLLQSNWDDEAMGRHRDSRSCRTKSQGVESGGNEEG